MLLVLISAVVWLMTPTSGEVQDFCITESFQASCGEDEVIVMETANYGRMRIGRCVRTDFGYVGCSASVLDILDRRCSGRKSCVLRVADPILEARTDCNSEFKSYLETNYTCTKVADPHGATCETAHPIPLPLPVGHIANVVTERTSCGSNSSPWLIEAKPGQRINFTLYDFALPALTNENQPSASICHMYAVITEKAGQHKVQICGKSSRVTQAYISVTHAVEVRIVRKQNLHEKGYFILKYELVGCTEPVYEEGIMWAKRSGDSITMGCNKNTNTWELTCEGSTWTGNMGNCSEALPSGTNAEYGNLDVVRKLISLPIDIAIALILAVAFVVGVIIFVIGLIALRRRHASLASRRQQAIMMREAHENTLRKMQPMEHQRGGGGGDHMMYSTTKIPGGDTGSNENEYAYVWDVPGQQQQQMHHHQQHPHHHQLQHHPSSACASGTMPRKFSDPGLPVQRGTLGRSAGDYEKRTMHPQYFELDDTKPGKGGQFHL